MKPARYLLKVVSLAEQEGEDSECFALATEDLAWGLYRVVAALNLARRWELLARMVSYAADLDATPEIWPGLNAAEERFCAAAQALEDGWYHYDHGSQDVGQEAASGACPPAL